MRGLEETNTIKNIRSDFFRKMWKSYIFLGLFLCLGCIAFFPVRTYAKEPKTVRVGYYYSYNFQEGTADDETKSGYSYEYLQKLSSYTGWKYE